MKHRLQRPDAPRVLLGAVKALAGADVVDYDFAVSTLEKICDKARLLPQSQQQAVLEIVEELCGHYPSSEQSGSPLALHESAEVRATLAAWEEDWNAPGMEAYDRP